MPAVSAVLLASVNSVNSDCETTMSNGKKAVISFILTTSIVLQLESFVTSQTQPWITQLQPVFLHTEDLLIVISDLVHALSIHSRLHNAARLTGLWLRWRRYTVDLKEIFSWLYIVSAIACQTKTSWQRKNPGIFNTYTWQQLIIRSFILNKTTSVHVWNIKYTTDFKLRLNYRQIETISQTDRLTDRQKPKRMQQTLKYFLV